MMPACGPPRSLSPLNITRLTPAATLSTTDGSSPRAATPVGEAEEPAAEILDHGDGRSAGQGRRGLGRRWRSAKPSMVKFDGWTRRDQRRAIGDGRGIVRDARPVGRADLAQERAGLRHDVGHSEPAADFDELAAGDDHLASCTEGGQRDERRRCIVVDDDRGLGAGQPTDQPLGVRVTPPTAALGQVVFKVGIARRRGQRLAPWRPRRAAPGRDLCGR